MKDQEKIGQIASMGFHVLSLAPTGYKSQGRTQGGGVVGHKSPPLSLICYKNFITPQRKLNLFAYFLLANLSTYANTTE